MKIIRAITGLALACWMGAAFANEIVGMVQDINPDDGTVTVEGIEFLVTEDTDFDMTLGSYADLERGQQVEISFEVSNGLHVINQIRPEPLQP